MVYRLLNRFLFFKLTKRCNWHNVIWRSFYLDIYDNVIRGWYLFIYNLSLNTISFIRINIHARTLIWMHSLSPAWMIVYLVATSLASVICYRKFFQSNLSYFIFNRLIEIGKSWISFLLLRVFRSLFALSAILTLINSFRVRV